MNDPDRSNQGQLASISSRFLARVIDAVAAALLLVVPMLASGTGPGLATGLAFSIGMGAYVAYLLFQDGLPNGQSIGKRIIGIRVVDRYSGEACGFGRSFVRNIFLALFGFIDLLFLSSELRQRLGDRAANTIVIWSRER